MGGRLGHRWQAGYGLAEFRVVPKPYRVGCPVRVRVTAGVRVRDRVTVGVLFDSF